MKQKKKGKHNLKRLLKRFFRKIKNIFVYLLELLRLPHVILTIVLVILAAISIILSHNTQQQFPFLSSVLSNVFAGLITGIAICLISGTKNIFNYKTKKTVDFLKEVHEECLTFLNAYKEMIGKAGNTNKSRDGFYDEIYDVLCRGNDIDGTISQSQFNKTLPFNPYKYFKKSLKYDAVEQMKKNELLRDKVLLLNANTVSFKELIGLFADMERNAFLLNGKVLSKINEIEIRQNISGKFFV